jgi:transcription antitermination factor NusG
LNFHAFKKPLYRRFTKLVQKPKPLPKEPSRPLPQGLIWYVLVTSPNREYHIAEWLEMLGHMTLVVLETRYKLIDPRRPGAREPRKSYQVPRFPRLVLVGFSVPPNWKQIKDKHHVTGVLGFNGTPARMRDGEAERLQMTSEAFRASEAPAQLEAGKTARIVGSGPFTGCIVSITSIQGKNAETVANWFGKEQVIKIKTSDLEAVA